MSVLYTIGYTAFPDLDQFIDAIKQHNISVVIDVRSSPYSKYYESYNKENLESCLKSNQIYYRNYATEFGARQLDKSFYNNEGFLDFNLFTKSSKSFLMGAEKVNKSLSEDYNVVLMCAEKDPINCHRCIMISKFFFYDGINVKHIISEEKISTQVDIEKRLVDHYYPNRYQMSFLDMDSTVSEADYTRRAYFEKNKEIAYREEGNTDE